MKDGENKIRLGKQLIREDELEIHVPYRDDVFVLKYPDPIVKSQIEMEVARRLGSYPRSQYSANYLLQLEMIVTVDMLYVAEKCPTWYEGPFRDLDEERTMTLYNGYLNFQEDFRRRLRQGRLEGDGK